MNGYTIRQRLIYVVYIILTVVAMFSLVNRLQMLPVSNSSVNADLTELDKNNPLFLCIAKGLAGTG